MSLTHPNLLTVGAIAEHFGVRPWQVRRLCESKLIPEPPRVGAYRVFTPDALPGIEIALHKAGYLRVEHIATAG